MCPKGDADWSVNNPPGDSRWERWVEANEVQKFKDWIGIVDPWDVADFVQFMEDEYERECDAGPEDFTGN